MKKIIANMILIILVLLFVVKYLPMIFGYQIYVIESASMEPAYPVGSMIVVEKCDFSDVEINDVITFKQSSSNMSKTHRVIDIDEQKSRFTTKGDNNQEEDVQKVYSKALIGKVIYSVAMIGYIYLFIDTLPGMACIILLAVISILLSINPKSNDS